MTLAAPVSFDEFKGRAHFGSLDGLRAISIIGVVWHHASRSRDLFLAAQSAKGVLLFFGISGFLITTLLLRERQRRGDISLLHFYARRSLRILPLYYAVLALYTMAVSRIATGMDRDEFFHNLPYFLTYTSNWFVHLEGRVIFYFSWSLATEEQFYLVWPSVEKWLPRAAVAMALGSCALRLAAELGWLPLAPNSFVRTVILSIQPAICLSAVLAHGLDSRRTFDRWARVLGAPLTSPLLLAALFVTLWLGINTWLVQALMVLLVGSCVINENHFLAPLLRSRPLESIGKASYGIYLLHMLGIKVVERVLAKLDLRSPIALLIGALLLTWMVALVSLRYFEAFFLRHKTRFART